MPIRLAPLDAAFVERVQGYCTRGLSEPEMAEAEGTALTSFRLRLLNCGFKVDKLTTREVIRTGSRERFVDLVLRGEFVVAEEATGAAA